MSRECLFAELGLEEDWYRLYHDNAWECALSKRYNDISEQIVGRRLLCETPRDPDRIWPETKRLHDIFEAENVWHSESYWIMQSAHSPQELSALLDRVEKRLENLRDFILPENWDEEKARLTALGEKVPLYRGAARSGHFRHLHLRCREPDLPHPRRQAARRAVSGPHSPEHPGTGPGAGRGGGADPRHVRSADSAGRTTTAPCSTRKCMGFSATRFSRRSSRSTARTRVTPGPSTPTPTWRTCCRMLSGLNFNSLNLGPDGPGR